FCHAQKNASALFVGLSLGEIAVGLCRLDFRLPVAPCSVDRLLMIFLLRGHAALKRKDLQTAQQKLSERQRRCTHVQVRHRTDSTWRTWSSAPGLGKFKTSALKARFTSG